MGCASPSFHAASLLNVLAALNSSWFFLAVLGTGVAGWLMMNGLG
jgi:hypothetical protein